MEDRERDGLAHLKVGGEEGAVGVEPGEGLWVWAWVCNGGYRFVCVYMHAYIHTGVWWCVWVVGSFTFYRYRSSPKQNNPQKTQTNTKTPTAW